jgi:hypothetical protein
VEPYVLFTVITLMDPSTGKLTDISQNSQEFSSQDLCVIALQTFNSTIPNDVHLSRVGWCAKR